MSDGPAFVRDRWGSARGLVRAFLARAALRLGAYSSAQAIDGAAVQRIVFVCRGNICRSPFAESVARRLGLTAASAALRGRAGAPANDAALAAARRHGHDLAAHRVDGLDGVCEGDLLVAMEPAQWRALRAHFAATAGVQVTLLGLWSSPPCPHVHDPYGLSAAYFDRCFERIEAGVRGLATALGRGG